MTETETETETDCEHPAALLQPVSLMGHFRCGACGTLLEWVGNDKEDQ